MLVTQYEGSVIEDTGLIKMDFFGSEDPLRLSKKPSRMFRLTTGKRIDIDTINIETRKHTTYTVRRKNNRNLPV